MTLTQLFTFVGAPLANNRWSWGAVRPKDGAVFLRVWQDECRAIDGMQMVQITFHKWFMDNPGNLGYTERLKHINLIRGGAPSYMVMCEAVDIKASPRTVKSFNDREIFIGGKLTDHAGDSWLQRVERRPVGKVRA